MKFSEWLVLKEFNYPASTLQMDKMGSLHMWHGDVKPISTGTYSFQANGKDADVYVQNKVDVNSILDNLTREEKEDLEKGYSIVTKSVPSEYFSTNEAKKWIQKVDMKKGAFTDYCGGKVTQDCIDKAMKSDDAHVVHMATLAQNLRKIAKKKKK